METQVLSDILKSTLLTRLLRMSVMIIILLIICAVQYFKRHRLEKSTSREEKKRKPYKTAVEKMHKEMLYGWIITAVMIVFVLTQSIPMCIDYSQNQYVQVDAKYFRTSHPEGFRDWLGDGNVEIVINGNTTSMKLPVNWQEADFPEGRYTGKIWYAKNSKILLVFLPGE